MALVRKPDSIDGLYDLIIQLQQRKSHFAVLDARLADIHVLWKLYCFEFDHIKARPQLDTCSSRRAKMLCEAM
jgi:hypothetical protein